MPNYNDRNDKQDDQKEQCDETIIIILIVISAIESPAVAAVAIYLINRCRIRIQQRRRTNVSDNNSSVVPIDVPNGRP